MDQSAQYEHWQKPLAAAHRGYSYQDLLTALRLTDVLLGSVIAADVDCKLFPKDIFDDLTVVAPGGARERAQFKNRETPNTPLPMSTFTGKDQRSLSLVEILASVLKDRESHGTSRPTIFRVVLGDTRPVDPDLVQVLRPIARDPGPFVAGMNTLRMSFDPERLWPVGLTGGAKAPFEALCDGRFERADVVWMCEHLIVEVDAPAASFNLLVPGPAEVLLLDRMRADLGAGCFPNTARTAVDVAAAMIRAANAARIGKGEITARALLRTAQLRSDFGAIARAHPVEASQEVTRGRFVATSVEKAIAAAEAGRALVFVGPPGQGKSWSCHQLLQALTASSWIVAEHYCFLGDGDRERSERVLADTIFGSLLARIAEADPATVAEQRPKFAANEVALLNAVQLVCDSGRRVALVVDGIDHVTRVGGVSSLTDPSLVVAGLLAALELPERCTLIVLSQPGAHLRPLHDAGAETVDVPPLNSDELRMLAIRHRLLQQREEDAGASDLRSLPREGEAAVLSALAERSAGNALYATYLCREALRTNQTLFDAAAAVNSLPPFDGTLAAYYSHIVQGLDKAYWIAGVLSALDFSVTRAQLRELQPTLGYLVDGALERLKPVLLERVGQGGIRVYHESFARFLREELKQDEASIGATVGLIAQWLQKRGQFEDALAFRFLIPTLVRAKRDREAIDLIQTDFVSRAIANGHTVRPIVANLVAAGDCAARLRDWPAVVRCIELARAANTYEAERLESEVLRFAEIPLTLLGEAQFSERLLFDGNTTMSARIGLQLCSIIDARGGVAPWPEYMAAFLRERKADDVRYDADADRDVALPWLRGKLRVVAQSVPEDQADETFDTNILAWSANWIQDRDLPAQPVVDAICDTLGLPAAEELADRVVSAELALVVAERLAECGGPTERVLAWGTKASERGLPPGSAHRLLLLGLPAPSAEAENKGASRDALIQLTLAIQDERALATVATWLDACATAARLDPIALVSIESLIGSPGWYSCWLKFAIALCRAEAAPSTDQSSLSLSAIRELTVDVRPFVGKPRACDLYTIHAVIASTLRRALRLLDDAEWVQAVPCLQHVSEETTTSLKGSLGGPLPPHLLLDLVTEGTSASRVNTVRSLVQATTSEPPGRLYDDIASYHLAAARFGLRIGDRTYAVAEWQRSCRMLVAYGYRKDPTIYELLDPMAALTVADPIRSRMRLAALQPLCERVVQHTDGRGTRNAPARWWALLAQADPTGLALLILPALLQNVNLPCARLHDALTELWKANQAALDPIVAAALRLTLDPGIEPCDAEGLARFVGAMRVPNTSGIPFSTLLLSRADERPVHYAFSNGGEFLARDNELLAKLNLAARSANLQEVLAAPIETASAYTNSAAYQPRTEGDFDTLAFLLGAQVQCFESGLRGLVRAVRAWAKRPFRASSNEWSPSRFANVIGYRIAELADGGLTAEAETALWALGDSITFSEEHDVLRAVADGLDARGYGQLAVVALVLAWTRTRGGGGWLAFGGETSIECLHRAAALDSSAAVDVLAAEVRNALSKEHGATGLSQALIYAFATVNFGAALGTTACIDVAFASWDQAQAVIAERLPRITASDDPDLPYTSNEGLGSADAAAAAAIVGALGHPGREQKRRAIAALRLLLSERAGLAAGPLTIALNELSDPTTLTWVLHTISAALPGAREVVEHCAQELLSRTQDANIVVRAAARRLLDLASIETVTPPPALEADGILALEATRIALERSGAELVLPPFERLGTESDDRDGVVADLVARHAGERVLAAEKLIPGLRHAVESGVSQEISGAPYRERIRHQLEALTSSLDRTMPDAFLAFEETVDRVLQRVAGTGRAALAMAGKVVSDPINWERSLSEKLSPIYSFPMALEFSRVPRPDVEPPPTRDASIWGAISRAAAGGSSGNGEIVGAAADDDFITATIGNQPACDLPVVEAGAYRGWLVAASAELRLTPREGVDRQTKIRTRRFRSIELREPGESVALELRPFATGDAALWLSTVVPEGFRPGPASGTMPLIGLLDEPPTALMSDFPVLVPGGLLVAWLELRPVDSGLLQLHDQEGPAIALRSWRCCYTDGEYELARPQLVGSQLLVRSDVFERLSNLVAAARGSLVIREYVAFSRHSDASG